MGSDGDEPQRQGTASGARGEKGDGAPPMPRWVKILGLVLLAVALAAILAMLVSGGQHGPRRHGALSASITGTACTMTMTPALPSG